MEGRKLVAFQCIVTVGLLFLLPLTAHADVPTAAEVAGSTTLTRQPTGSAEATTMTTILVAKTTPTFTRRPRPARRPPPSPPPLPPKKEKKKLTCLEKYRLRSDKCSFKHEWCKRESEDEDEKAICDVADDSCERKAYMLYKKCKYDKWTCKDWCAYNKMRYMEDDRLSATTCKKRADYCYEKCNPKPIQKDDDHHDDDDDN
ncbi:unnamed protein product [Closterium sp. NIES-54]